MIKIEMARTVFLAASLLISPLIFGSSSNRSQFPSLTVNSHRLEKRLMKLAEIGQNEEGGVSRLAYSQADIQGRQYLMSLMKEAGLKVRIDEAANIIGQRPGKEKGLSPIVFGSHADSVPNGGKYDGALGVLAAIECVQVLEENNIVTRHPLQVVVFTDEEGGLIGSRAMIGHLTPETLQIVSDSGRTIREGIKALGGDPDNLDKARLEPGEIKAFLELHIEQGAVLESKKINVGIVQGIVGINWWEVTVEGMANHAGTTPMDMRHDALLAVSHLIVAVNRVVTSSPGRQVGTVGKIQCEPGAANVIPAKVIMSLELRDLSSEKIKSLFKEIKTEAAKIATLTRTKIKFKTVEATAVPAPTDPRLQKCIKQSAQELGLTYLLMPSGAGHDAQNMARITPAGMIFIPSVGGISHSPREYSRPQDITNGANVLLRTILKIDQGALD